MLKKKWSVVTINLVFFIIQAAVIIILFLKGRLDYVWSVAVTAAFWAVYTLCENRYNLKMNPYVRVLVMLTLFFDAFFGYCFDLYILSSTFDKVLHAFGTYAFSLFAYILFMQLFTGSMPKPAKFILAVCLGLSMGAFYEILEFITDNISHPIPPSQPSLLDTDLDLACDLLGGVLAAVHVLSRNFINKDF